MVENDNVIQHHSALNSRYEGGIALRLQSIEIEKKIDQRLTT